MKSLPTQEIVGETSDKALCSVCWTWTGEPCEHYPTGQREAKEQAMIDRAIETPKGFHHEVIGPGS